MKRKRKKERHKHGHTHTHTHTHTNTYIHTHTTHLWLALIVNAVKSRHMLQKFIQLRQRDRDRQVD